MLVLKERLGWALATVAGVLSCAAPMQMSPEKAASWVESRGGSVSYDFQAFEITTPDRTAIAHVDLGSRPIKDSDLQSLDTLGTVYGLSLSGTGVTDAGLAHVSRLSTLQRLLLDHTDITDAGLAQVGKLRELRRLSLVHTRITDAGLAHLKDLSKL